jgi:hypothetical protein
MAQMYILDLLDSMPRLRMSGAMMKSILWALNKLDVPDVPSFKQLRKTQKTLAQKIPISPSRHESATGNIFYQNSLGALLALVSNTLGLRGIKSHHMQDWANPLVLSRWSLILDYYTLF